MTSNVAGVPPAIHEQPQPVTGDVVTKENRPYHETGYQAEPQNVERNLV